MIPQADPGAGYRAQQAEIDAAVARALASGWYILGQEGEAFEGEFARWLGAEHAVGCANGTDALALALRALGVGQGASVVTVSHTAVATVAAIEMVGAEPLLIDIDPARYTMDPAELAEVLASPPAGMPPIRAVIPVHLYGQAADLAPILAACARHDVPVIEDCSQAHGASYHGRKLGTLGRIGTFSLYPTKNLGALGDGGVVVTQDAGLAERLRSLRQYGWQRRYISEQPGVNSRLDEVQAAILRVRLRHLDAANARRGAIASAYDAVVSAPPFRAEGCGHVFHQYVVQYTDRDAQQTRLRAAGVGTGVHYPVPVHLQPAYAGRVGLGPSACRRTAEIAQAILSLPMFAELTDAQVQSVSDLLR